MDGEHERNHRHEDAGEDPSLYLNRELSWLDFNDRVLQLAEDEQVPLLERVKFCAIYTTNLDEYYMVRVAGLRDQIDAGVENPTQDGRIPSETIALIRERVLEQGGRLTGCFEGRLRPAARRPRHPARERERARRGAPRGAGQALPEGDLPSPHPAGRGSRTAVPLHLQPVAQPRRARARPRQRPDRVRAREGPDRDPPPLRHPQAVHARHRPAGAARGRDRQPPGRAVPGHGDRRLRRLQGHPRRRPRGLRRRRRPAAGGRGRAAPQALRRGRAGRGRVQLLRAAARGAREPARGTGGGGLPGRRPARHGRAVADRQAARPRRAARGADRGHHPSAAAAPRGRSPGCARRDARRRSARPPPLRVLRHLGRALRRAGRRGPQRAGDQADRLPHQRRLAAGARADRRDRARQAGGRAGRAAGALRRAHEHPLGQGAWRRPGCTSSTASPR